MRKRGQIFLAPKGLKHPFCSRQFLASQPQCLLEPSGPVQGLLYFSYNGKATPIQAQRVPVVRSPLISVLSAHENSKVVSPTHRRLLYHRKYSWYSLRLEAESIGRIKSMKNPKDPIGNLTCKLPPCRAMPEPNAPPRAS